MQELFQTFRGVLDGFDGPDEIRAAFVFAAWRKIAGEQLRQRTEPLGFRQKRLTLAVENAIWKRHLEDLSGDMLYRLNAALGQGVVNFIEFCVHEKAVLAAPDRKTVKAPDEAVAAKLSPALKNAALRIGDPELRKTFLDAAGAYLARKADIGTVSSEIN